ncbi:uncharacterized protein [Excalfactoria chinensis]|uniref:uncharacterized protein n=1 Tax=Excalfactoria chinensis TaxID=46218 RepID=UPI003B3B49D4
MRLRVWDKVNLDDIVKTGPNSSVTADAGRERPGKPSAILSSDRKSACRAVKPPPGSNESAWALLLCEVSVLIRLLFWYGTLRLGFFVTFSLCSAVLFQVAVGRLPVKISPKRAVPRRRQPPGSFSAGASRSPRPKGFRQLFSTVTPSSLCFHQAAFSRIRKRATTAGDGRHLKEEKEAGRREYCGRQDKQLGDVARRTRKDGEPKGAQPSAREGRRAGVTSPGVTVWVSSAAEHLDGGRVSPASRLSQRFIRSSSRSRGGIGSEQLHGARKELE